jgi:hypothetical protein
MTEGVGSRGYTTIFLDFPVIANHITYIIKGFFTLKEQGVLISKE